MVFTLSQRDDSTKDHVDGCGHQSRRYKDQEVLHHVRPQGPAPWILKRIENSTDVSNGFACIEGRVSSVAGFLGWLAERTQTAAYQSREIPGLALQHLKPMKQSCDGKEDCEDYSCLLGWLVPVFRPLGVDIIGIANIRHVGESTSRKARCRISIVVSGTVVVEADYLHKRKTKDTVSGKIRRRACTKTRSLVVDLGHSPFFFVAKTQSLCHEMDEIGLFCLARPLVVSANIVSHASLHP